MVKRHAKKNEYFYFNIIIIINKMENIDNLNFPK